MRIIREMPPFVVYPSPDLSRPLENQELASTDHVDTFINVERDERRERQKRIGKLFVKYGICPAEALKQP